MSWYSVIYMWAREYRAKNPIRGWFLHQFLNILLVIQCIMAFVLSYIYYHAVCYHFLESKIQVAVYISVHFVFFSMAMWSLIMTLVTAVTKVPEQYQATKAFDESLKVVTPYDGKRYQPDKSSAEQVTSQNKLLTAFCNERKIRFVEVDHHNRFRYCYQCNLVKPDRAHHCSSCGFCVVKFDHHCPWINKCVNYGNYKYFVLYIVYSVFTCIWMALTSIEAFARYFVRQLWLDDLVPFTSVVFGLIFICIFGYYPLGEMLIYHRSLMALNETTCEQAKVPNILGDNRADYNMGTNANIRQAMGWGLWMFPVPTHIIDGLHYQIRYVDDANVFKMDLREMSKTCENVNTCQSGMGS